MRDIRLGVQFIIATAVLVVASACDGDLVTIENIPNLGSQVATGSTIADSQGDAVLQRLFLQVPLPADVSTSMPNAISQPLPPYALNFSDPTDLPGFASVPNNSAFSKYNISGSSFDVSFNLATAGNSYDFVLLGAGPGLTPGLTGSDVAQSEGTICFVPSTNLNFQASGNVAYSIGDKVNFQAELFEFDPVAYAIIGDPFFQSTQDVLGGFFGVSPTSGNLNLATDPNLSGALTGQLLAGHTYVFDYDISVGGNMLDAGADTANGYIDLSFTPVPEPLVTGVFAIFLASIWRQRRS